MMQRLFWFTVEFGLIGTEEGIRIYGAGIASSAGKTPYAVESDRPERRPFDALTVFRTPYRIDIFQTVYYVIVSDRQLYDMVHSELIDRQSFVSGTRVSERVKIGGSSSI